MFNVTYAGLANIEQMHSALNRDGVNLQIDGLRVPEVARCHVLLRQMDARESAVDKHIVLDLASAADLQIMLKQVRASGTFACCLDICAVSNTDEWAIKESVV